MNDRVDERISTVDVDNSFDVDASAGTDAVVVVLEDNVEVIQTFQSGPPGPPGPQGVSGPPSDVPGPQGNSVRYGNRDPSGADGVADDFWINTVTHFIFGPKTAVWPAGTSLIGPVGPQGVKGDTGAQGPQGIQGNTGGPGPVGPIGPIGPDGVPGNTLLYGSGDPTGATGVNGNFYINMTTHFIFGPKTGGAWPAGTSMIGPQGAQGVQGPKGDKGDTGSTGPAGGIPEPANDGKVYGRGTTSGVSAWTRAVPITGDTMTGNLQLQTPNPQFNLLKAASGQNNQIGGFTGANYRWSIVLGDGVAEGGADAGSNFVINRHSDAGTYLGSPFQINRANGNVSMDNGGAVMNVVVSGSSSQVQVNKAGNAAANFAQVSGTMNGAMRWQMMLADNSAEPGGDVGSNFQLNRYSDAGTHLGTSFRINRATGTIELGGATVVNGMGPMPSTPHISSMSFGYGSCLYGPIGFNAYVTSAGTWAAFTSAYVMVESFDKNSGTMAWLGGSANAGAQPAALPTLMQVDYVGNFIAKGQVSAQGLSFAVNTNTTSRIYQSGADYYYQPDGATYWGYNSQTAIWTLYLGGTRAFWRQSDTAFFHYGPAYKPAGGMWADSSDARIKNVLGEYTSGLEQINALRPVRFTYRGNDTLSEPAHNKLPVPDGEPQPEPRTDPIVVPYENSGHHDVAAAQKEFIGLIAQEAEGPMPEIVSLMEGFIDGEAVTDLRNVDATPIIYALINAVKELTARVQQLEAAR